MAWIGGFDFHTSNTQTKMPRTREDIMQKNAAKAKEASVEMELIPLNHYRNDLKKDAPAYVIFEKTMLDAEFVNCFGMLFTGIAKDDQAAEEITDGIFFCTCLTHGTEKDTYQTDVIKKCMEMYDENKLTPNYIECSGCHRIGHASCAEKRMGSEQFVRMMHDEDIHYYCTNECERITENYYAEAQHREEPITPPEYLRMAALTCKRLCCTGVGSAKDKKPCKNHIIPEALVHDSVGTHAKNMLTTIPCCYCKKPFHTECHDYLQYVNKEKSVGIMHTYQVPREATLLHCTRIECCVKSIEDERSKYSLFAINEAKKMYDDIDDFCKQYYPNVEIRMARAIAWSLLHIVASFEKAMPV